MSAAEKLKGDPAHTFLTALGPGPFTFQTFGEGSHRGTHNLSSVLHGDLFQHERRLRQLNMRGAGVFVMVNLGDCEGRKTLNVRNVRAVFADLDGTPLESVRQCSLQPHLITETSPDRWHAYWLADGLPLEAFAGLQKAIAAKFDADPTVCDLPRVVRLPGYLHRKGRPFETRIVECHNQPRYTHAQLMAEFKPGSGDQAKKALPDVIVVGSRNNTLFRLAGNFVRQGFSQHGIDERLKRLNRERCLPPLPASEVETLVARACAAGSSGFVRLPHKLLDSGIWKGLQPTAALIVVEALRRYNGSNNGNIALAWRDFDGRPGFAKSAAFYRHRQAVIDAGILQRVKHASNGQHGRKPDLFAIAKQWLA